VTAARNGFFQRRFDAWLARRLPRVERIRLDRRSVFTFPSRQGLGLVLVLVLLWLLATNYQNNLVFAFGALLGSLMVVTIFHSFANLAGLEVRILGVGAGFPGDSLKVEVEVSQRGRRHREDIWLSFPGAVPQRVALPRGEQTAIVTLFIPARRRGLRPLDRLTLETCYPLGLIRVWTHVLLRGAGVVYPRPIAGASTAGGNTGDAVEGSATTWGSEDFEGLALFRPGESRTRIAWKQLARGLGVYSKQFSDPVADPTWLDWHSYPGLDREARLCRLCHGVLEAAAGDSPFGLRLPGSESTLGRGEIHRDSLLRMLALFECEGA